MTLPNDSLLVTPGSGTVMATHLVSGKEYEAIPSSLVSGHLDGSEPIYYFSTDPFNHTESLASATFFDMFNGGAAGTIVRIRSILHIILIEGAVAAAYFIWTVFGGATSPIGGVNLPVRKLDTNDPNPDSGIIARKQPTAPSGGLFVRYIYNRSVEESSANAQHPHYQETLPPIFRQKGFVLNVGESMRITKSGPSNDPGASCIIVFFSVEA